jgi:hypothetical protein
MTLHLVDVVCTQPDDVSREWHGYTWQRTEISSAVTREVYPKVYESQQSIKIKLRNIRLHISPSMSLLDEDDGGNFERAICRPAAGDD